MSEFTIRNKATRPIVTLKPYVLKALLNARPTSASLVLSKFRRDYEATAGKRATLDHEQLVALLRHYRADERGMWTSPYAKLPMPWFLVEKAFVDGFLSGSVSRGLLDDLGVVESFYGLLDPLLPRSAETSGG